MKRLLLILLLFFCASCFAQNVINVRLYGGSNFFRNSQWNNWNVGTGAKTNITSGLFNYTDGTSSSVSAILSGQDALADNGAAYAKNAVICPDTVLRYCSYALGERTLTISGLDNSQKYNLEFYASRLRNDGQKTLYTIGTQTITVSTDNNSTNVANFSSIAPVAGKIAVKMARASAYNYINGFKISPTIVILPPVVNAGINQLVRLPINTASLDGTAVAGSSKIISTGWSQLNGPAIANIDAASSLSTTVSNLVKGIYIFKLTVTDSLGSSAASTVQVNVLMPPGVNAGTNQIILLPINSVTLKGTDTVGSSKIITTGWSQLSGPASSSINQASSLIATAGNLIQGVYIFKLTVTDSLGSVASSTVQVIVQSPPVVSAGANQIITLPVNSVGLNGTVLQGSSGIVSINWSQVSGPSAAAVNDPASPSTTARNLSEGTYIFQLSAVDSLGLVAQASTQVIVKPTPPPHVNAGPDQTVSILSDSAQLKGVDSAGGSIIISTTWTELIGPGSAAIFSPGSLNTEVGNLAQGTYMFQLTVTDSLGLTASDTTQLVVNPPAPPIALAGADREITAPQNSLILYGRDSAGDSKIIATLWSKLGGPDSAIISTPDSLTTLIQNLVQGTYIYQLSVTDSLGFTSKDTTRVTVKPPVPPVVSAGNNQVITAPANSLTLKGTDTAGSSRIVSNTWSQLSGPDTAIIASLDSLSSLVGNLIQGTYIFQLFVIDSMGLSASSTVQVLIQPMNTGHKKIGVMGSSTAAGLFNNLWPADSSWPRQLFHYYQFNTVDTLYNLAQSTENIYNAMPTGYSAGNSLQPVATYATNPARNITKMISLHPDVILCHYPSNNYDYLTTAQVMFAMRTIKAAADSAGISLFFVGTQPRGSLTTAAHQNLIDINDSLIMEFGARTISYYDSLARTPRSFWMNPVFWLNNDSVHLNPKGHDVILRQIIQSNIFSSAALIVSAGNNQTVTLPVNFTLLSGKIIGGSGNVVATTWSQLTGPADANIGAPNALATQVSNLVRGTYVFKLSVTDSSGTSWTSTVQVIVNPVPPPTVSAGGNKAIILPMNSVTLSGTVTTHGGGPIVAITWTQISGSISAVLSSPGSLVTQVDSLSLGNYTFSLTVTDSSGVSGNDSAVITVASGASINVRLYSGINPFKNSQWNNWTVGTALGNNMASGVLKYQDGSISTVSAVLSAQTGSADNGANYTSGASMCPDTVLRYCSYSLGTRTLVLSGLDNSRKYNLECYASRARTDGQKSSFTMGSKTITVLTDNNSSSAALLLSVSPVNGSITITITRGSAYNYLNGFKITQATDQAAHADEMIALAQANETGNEPWISIYPNPVSESLTILNHGSDQLRVEIYDMAGRRMVAFSDLFTERQIGMSRFAAGTYIVVVTDEKTREVFRKTILKN